MKAILLFGLVSLTFSFASADDQYSNNCAYLKSITRLNRVVSLEREDGLIDQMRMAYQALCRLPYSNGATVNYPNGKMATISYGHGGYNWYYPNGETITSGSSYSTWYYPNREQISSAMQPGYTVNYPNGKIATSNWMKSNASWFYPNGQTITSSAGSKGFSWYYANGQAISSSMGNQGATWYDRSGQVLTNNGPELSEEELINVPAVLSRILINDLR